MRFDTDKPGNLFFDKRKSLTAAELDDLKARSGNFVDNVFNEMTPFTRDSYGNRTIDGNKFPYWLLIPSILAILAGVFLKNVLIIMIGFASAVVIMGIYVAITGGVKSVKNAEAYSDRMANRVIGIVLIFCAIVPFIVWYVFLDQAKLLERALLTASSAIAGLGFLVLLSFLFMATAKARIYKQEVKATCIGYARFIEYDTVGAGKTLPVPFVSPVFEYTYLGKKITAVYDGFCKGTDSDIDLGETTIHVSPASQTESITARQGIKSRLF